MMRRAMDARKNGKVHMLRLDRGEPVLASLHEYIGREGILGGSIVGLGALEATEIGYFDPARRSYDRTTIPEARELLSLVGTISRLDGKPFVHAHVTLGAPDHSVVGGHLFEARVAVTGEFVIDEATIASRRELDDATGLKLLRFDEPSAAAGRGANPRGSKAGRS
jgi:predicted DNA-binding protein with PD1-like motif